ncbi:GspH/FimT family pseudopilin [Desulfocastanea catecholica]
MAVLRNNRGVSLVEVLTVVGIIGILSAVAIPNMFSWLSNKGLQSAGRDLYSNMRKAQSTAIKNNRNCAVSFDDDKGYMVYVDTDKSFSHNGVEQIIAQVLWSQYRNVQFVGVNFADNDDGDPTIAFRPNLLPDVKPPSFPNGTVTLKNSVPRQLELKVSRSGNISLE